jgi:hypothetical protein
MKLKHRPSPALFVGLLALFVALGGVGVAATGDNFILGHSNSASSRTDLTANIANRALGLTNTSTGSGASALALNVASGHPPLVVSPGAGTATNLNADLLDTHDSTYFLPKTGTAANSLKLGGQLPSYYLPASVVRRVEPMTGSPGSSPTLIVLGQLTFYGFCYSNGSIETVGLAMRSSADHAAYADLTQAAAGGDKYRDPNVLSGFAYTLAAVAGQGSGSAAFAPVTGEALSADGHEVFYNLYMGQNARGATGDKCVFGGSFVVT